MLLLVSDENFNNDIVRGLLRRNPDLDIVRVQDVGLRGEDDPTILEWAAHEGRVLLTHDAATMAHFAYERVKAGKQSCKNNFRTLTTDLSDSHSVSWLNRVVPVWTSCMSCQA